jgi:hypothetical protein
LNGSGPCEVGPWWWWRRPGRVAGVAVGLLLVERLLVGEMGSPTALVRMLQDLGEPGADPILSTLALMALLAETLVGHLLLVLALRSLAMLPGLTGRLARRITFALAPAVVRRLLDLLVGGTCLSRSPWQPPTRRSVIDPAAPARRWSPRRHAAGPAGQ